MPMLRRPLKAAAVIASVLLLPVTPALASGADVILDCNDNGRLTRKYTQKEYRQALAQMPADVRQYTDCENIIRRAQLGLPSYAANAANPFAGATPEEEARARAFIARAQKAGGARRFVGTRGRGGFFTTPGALSYTRVSAATSELPTPLLVLLALVVIAALAGGARLGLARFRERDPGA